MLNLDEGCTGATTFYSCAGAMAPTNQKASDFNAFDRAVDDERKSMLGDVIKSKRMAQSESKAAAVKLTEATATIATVQQQLAHSEKRRVAAEYARRVAEASFSEADRLLFLAEEKVLLAEEEKHQAAILATMMQEAVDDIIEKSNAEALVLENDKMEAVRLANAAIAMARHTMTTAAEVIEPPSKITRTTSTQTTPLGLWLSVQSQLP